MPYIQSRISAGTAIMLSFEMIFSPRIETVSMIMPRMIMVASRFQ